MKKVKLYQYKKCSTCIKGVKFLAAKKIEAKILDITETPPSKTELKKMLAFYNGELKKLFNTSGVMYRELKMKDKIADISVADAIQLLSENGKLVKRPFLLTESAGLVGFKEDEWKNFFS